MFWSINHSTDVGVEQRMYLTNRERERVSQELREIIVRKIQLLAQGERWNHLVKHARNVPPQIKLCYTKLGKGRCEICALDRFGLQRRRK